MNGPTASGWVLKNIINSLSKEINSKKFMMGFSSSGGFTNRFAIIHLNRTRVAAIGGVGWMTVPLTNWEETKLKFSCLESGVSKLETFSGERFDL
jgi:hypothetical protein